MNRLAIFTFPTIFAFIFGCANQGGNVLRNLTEADVNSLIVVGETTRNEIRALFGEPHNSTTYSKLGIEIWKYRYEDTAAWNRATVASDGIFLESPKNRHLGKQKELTIIYDEDYTVKRFNMSSSAGESPF